MRCKVPSGPCLKPGIGVEWFIFEYLLFKILSFFFWQLFLSPLFPPLSWSCQRKLVLQLYKLPTKPGIVPVRHVRVRLLLSFSILVLLTNSVWKFQTSRKKQNDGIIVDNKLNISPPSLINQQMTNLCQLSMVSVVVLINREVDGIKLICLRFIRVGIC
jgi:hypothetical protein